MKDKLGREIERGDKLAYVGLDYCHASGINRKLSIVLVVDIAPFALQLEPVDVEDEYFRSVVSDPSEMVIVAQ